MHTIQISPGAFAQQPLYAVAFYSAAQLFADRKTNADRRLLLLCACSGVNEHELPRRLGLAIAVYMAELLVPL